MPYTNSISIEQALYFDLFDDIKYEWLKEVLDPKRDREEYDFDVEIKDIPHNEDDDRCPSWCKTSFTFELRQIDYIRFGETYYKTKTFTKKIEYNGSSGTALSLMNLWIDNESDEEESENDDDEN